MDRISGSGGGPGGGGVKAAAALRLRSDAAESGELADDIPAAEWYHAQSRDHQVDRPGGGASTSAAAPQHQQQPIQGAAPPLQRPRPPLEPPTQPSPRLWQQQEQPGADSTPSAPKAGRERIRFASSVLEAERENEDNSAASSERGGGGAAVAVRGPGLKAGHPGGGSLAFYKATQLQQQKGGGAGGSGRRGSTSPHESPTGSPSERSAAAASGPSFAASLRGLLGGASSRLFGSLLGASMGGRQEAQQQEEEGGRDLWFTRLEDFKPLCHMLHRGHAMTGWFAQANKTGHHYVLKKYDKHKMTPAQEQGVRRAIAFAEMLDHPALIRCMGNWECKDFIYIVEEYVNKGDVLNEAISHPDKYTERFVALNVVTPLLQVLSYMHSNNIIHRTVAPENVLVGLDDRVRLGHLTSALDQHSDRPASRLGLLDYMAPEMMAVRGGAERDLALAGVLRTAGGDDGSGSEDGRGDEIELMAGRRGDTVVQRLGYGGWGDEAGRGRGDKQEQLEPGSAAAIAAAAEGLAAAPSLDWMASPQRAAARLSQHSPPTSGRPSPAPQPLALGSKLTPAASAASASDAGVGSAAGGAAGRPQSGRCRLAKYAPAEWEGRDYYNEKVDVWQLGCLVHELLCGSMPFETPDKLLSSALLLWADLDQPPNAPAPDAAAFLRAALTKDPAKRPGASQLLFHPWLLRCERGEPYRDPAELAAARLEAERNSFLGRLRAAAGAVASLFGLGGRQVAPGPNDGDGVQRSGGSKVGSRAGSRAGSRMGSAATSAATSRAASETSQKSAKAAAGHVRPHRGSSTTGDDGRTSAGQQQQRRGSSAHAAGSSGQHHPHHHHRRSTAELQQPAPAQQHHHHRR